MFTLKKIEGGRINVFEPERFLTSAEIKLNQALKLESGKLVDAGSSAPTFIALASVKGTTDGVECPVGRIAPNQVYAVPVHKDTTEVSAMVVGTKYPLYQVSGRSLNIASKASSTAAANVAELVDLNGATKDGDIVYIRFS